MISIAVPHENHWAISKVRTKVNPIAKTWIADCGDPFMMNILEKIKPPFYFEKLENTFLKSADFISVPTKTSAVAYNKLYHHKFRVIPQGFNFEEVKIVSTKPVHNCPTFAYAGGVSAVGIRSLHQVIKILKTVDKDFVFHVYSANGKALLKDVVKGFSDKVILHDAIPRKELLYKLSQMDFLINLDNGTHLNTPSKVIDYALAKRPIMNIDPISPIKNKIDNFLKGDYGEETIIEDLEAYNISNVAEKFLNLHS